MQRGLFRCFHRLRVRWAEVDMQKIVFNAHYLTYADTALTEYWRALALPYEASLGELGAQVYLKKVQLLYHASARLDDWLDVGLRCKHLGQSSMAFEAGIFAGDKLLVALDLLYVFADPQTQTKRHVPPTLRAIIEHYEAGGHMMEVRLGDWDTLGAQAARLRMAVFVQEQGIAPEEEIDALDAQCVHAVVFNRMGMALATGRLLPSANGCARIGRMAVVREMRGQCCGRMVLQALLDAARQRGDQQAMLHAQCSAQGFYRRAGWKPAGEVFDEVGIPHIRMERSLQAGG